jgi:hypothetical protein
MRSRHLKILVSAAAIGALVLAFSVHFATSTTTTTAHATGFYAGFNKIQQRIMSGFAANELNPTYKAPKTISYYPTSDDGCPQNLGSNVKLNHNCLNISDPALQGRGQAQQAIPCTPV